MRRRKSEGWMHPHPAAMVLYASRQILLLLIRVVHALFSFLTGGGFGKLLWLDLLALFGMWLLGFLRYLAAGYRIEREGIRFRNGILLRREGYLPFAKITVIAVEQPIWLKPLRYCLLRFDTDAGNSRETEFEISLTEAQAKELIRRYQVRYPQSGAVIRRMKAKWWEIAFLSLLCSDSYSGILYLSAAVSAVGDFFGGDLGAVLRENFRRLLVLSNLASRGIPRFAAWAAYLMLISWGISVMVHLLSTLRFSVVRQGSRLTLQNGWFRRYHHLIRTDAIHRIELRQNLLAKLWKMVSVFVCCSGYGKIGSKLPVLLPTGRCRRILPRLSLLLPEFAVTENSILPQKRYRRRFLFPPILLLTVTVGAFALVVWLFADWRETLLAFGIAVLLPEIWFLAARIAAFSHTGIGIQDKMLTLRYCKGFAFYTTVIPLDKITRIGTIQSPFQKRIGACDLMVNTRSEGKNRIRVANLPLDEVTVWLKDILL